MQVLQITLGPQFVLQKGPSKIKAKRLNDLHFHYGINGGCHRLVSVSLSNPITPVDQTREIQFEFVAKDFPATEVLITRQFRESITQLRDFPYYS